MDSSLILSRPDAVKQVNKKWLQGLEEKKNNNYNTKHV